MAPGRKTGGRNFRSGDAWTGNRNGRPSVPTDQKLALALVQQLRGEARAHLSIYCHELIHLTHEELQKVVGYKRMVKRGKKEVEEIVPPTPGTPVLKLLLARSFLTAMRTGKPFDVSVLKDLICGPEPKNINIGGEAGEPLAALAKFNQLQLASLFTVLDDVVKEAECKSTLSLPQSSESPARSSPPESGTVS